MPLKRKMTEVQTLEPGTYKVQLMDLKETILENPQFGSGDVIRFCIETTEVVDEEGNRIELDGIANDKLTPLSKLTRWLTAFGVTAEAGEEIDMEEAIGREAMAVIVVKPGKDGTGAFPRVDDLVPLPKSGKASSAPQKPTAASNGDSPDVDSFWRRIRAAGFDRADVLPYADGDLSTMGRKTQNELDQIMAEMGV